MVDVELEVINDNVEVLDGGPAVVFTMGEVETWDVVDRLRLDVVSGASMVVSMLLTSLLAELAVDTASVRLDSGLLDVMAEPGKLADWPSLTPLTPQVHPVLSTKSLVW